MLQRFLRRDHDDPYLALHTDTPQQSLYADEEKPPLLQQPRIKLIAGGALTLALVAFLFSGGSKEGSSIQIINAPTPTTRIKPADPQGLELPHQDMQVYSYVDPNGVQQPKVERLIPAPQDTPKLPPKPVAPAPAAVVEAPPVANLAPPLVTPPARQPGVPGALQSVATQPAPPVTAAGIPSAPLIVAPAPVAAPPRVVTPAVVAAAPAAAPVAAPTPAPASGSTFRLQLGSLRDMAAAQQHWKTAQARSGGVLAGLQPQILRVEIPGKGTYFRVQAGGWPTRQDAQKACDSLKQARVECMVVR